MRLKGLKGYVSPLLFVPTAPEVVTPAEDFWRVLAKNFLVHVTQIPRFHRRKIGVSVSYVTPSDRTPAVDERRVVCTTQ